MIPEKRKTNLSRAVSLFLAISLINQVVFPTAVYALTGGPSQPEVQSFEPIGTTQMVDPFTGDFVYNIPLMDVDGYPLNISYHSGINMEQEASWVGLGWNLNVGNINRGMRGLPDDFSGEKDSVIKKQNILTNWTVGIDINRHIEFTGIPFFRPGAGTGFGIFYNNYRGIGINFSHTNTFKVNFYGLNSDYSYSISNNSQEGISHDHSFHLGFMLGDKDKSQASMGFTVGSHFNTRAGTKSRTLGAYANTGYARAKRGVSTSSTIPVGEQTYVPAISLPMRNSALNLSFSLGGEVAWIAGSKRLSFRYDEQMLASSSSSNPAYGYLFTDKAQNEKRALYDINREKDGEFTVHKPMLPVTNLTYDVYSVTGQGVGGVYRPYRNDKGIVGDPLVEEKSEGFVTGGDVALGAYFKGGFNMGGSSNYNYSGKWESDEAKTAQSILKFKGKDESNPEYEPYYFKAAGELTPVNTDNYDEMGGDNAMNIDLESGKATDRFETWAPIKNTKFEKRQNRNQAIGVLNAEEATHAALEKEIRSYDINNSGTHFYTTTFRQDGIRKPNHISEITTYRPDGARYVYGIPAYNTYQKEVTFNSENGKGLDPDNGTVKYDKTDNTVKNSRGFDHYFSSTELPSYAHSYLLSAVLSADYVDRTQDGPTDDDLGTYTKFNYKRSSNDYNWRTPYADSTANLDEGFKSDKYDNKGNYIYGKKEVWYLRSIVTKNMVAEFYLSPRDDGKGVKDENGGLSNTSTNTLMKLDKISLYSKCERQSKGADAVPIQEVHFVYDKTYPLCPNVLNNYPTDATSKKGKLTLTGIYFTYQKSQKGKLSPYNFTYSDVNPSYASKSCDRWGNYKPNDPNYPNDDYPYTPQNRADANSYASAWALTKIDLPSGGKIEVNYEADDYAYVQDQRAMQMMQVTGFGRTAGNITSNLLFGDAGGSLFPNNYMKVHLPVPVSNAAEFKDKYLRPGFKESPIDKIYFRCMVNVKEYNVKEFVSGYAQITSECGIYGPPDGDNKYSEAYIKLKDIKIEEQGDGDLIPIVNPIARTSWQMTRLYFTKDLYKGSGKHDPGKENLGEMIVQVGQSIAGFFKDLNRNRRGLFYDMLKDGYGQQIDVSGKSLVRLFSPNYAKIGGGSRVKTILVKDGWKSMANHAKAKSASYGQEYSYTKEEGGETISSGVAEYEPLLGGEENPHRQPLAYDVEHWGIPSDRFYVETPVGESFYPAPSVGYSEVKVKSLQPGAGYIRHEYYTARDFPVINEHTGLLKNRQKPKILDRLLKFKTESSMTVSQGHIIKLNNMHGQKKAIWVYAEGQDQPISGQEFFYKTEKNNNRRLDNYVTTINKKGEVVKNTLVGKETDFIADLRRQKSESWTLDVETDIDCSPLPVLGFPLPIPSIVPRYATTSTDFKSAVVTKIITDYGILEKVVAYDQGSRVSTENLAYDSETGEVLLTRSENNFNDMVYTFNYPAHWAYDRMGMAYKNLGITLKGLNVHDGIISFDKEAYKGYFVKGDEVIISGSNKRLWIRAINRYTNDVSVKLLDAEGASPSDANNVSLTIVRSGRRNMQSLPVGSITLLHNPISDGRLSFSSILSASATEYSDSWLNYCECGINNGKMDNVLNPTDPDGDFLPGFVEHGNLFTQGAAGSWKVKRNYVYLTTRNVATENRNLNVRKDGTYTQFDPFWKSNKGRDWKPNNSNWAWTTEVTKVSAYGFELENRDSLNHFSSAVYGYSNTLAIAVAQNSRYKEIGVDNFEDYNCNNCGANVGKEDHWSFKNNADKIVSSVSHTGKRSIQVKKHSKASVGKKLVCKDKEVVQPG